MRLTLRTLLAYLDDVLDPNDKEELAQKIESSDFAKDLVHQTRDSVRRLRLSAPQVIGTGMGMDPNSVAEYLDNALPPEQVGDYERICLESDVHLAETAACHHVLTMVLGEPAEVEPRSKQRMYQIPAEARELRRLRAEPAHPRRGAATVSTSVSSPAAAVTPAVVRPQAPTTRAVEVPEYLRARPWWQSRAALGTFAAVLIVGAALYIVSDMAGVWNRADEVAAVNADAQMLPNDAKEEPQAEVVADATAPETTEPTVTPEQTVSTEPAATEPTATTADSSAAGTQPDEPSPQSVAPETGASQVTAATETPVAADASASVASTPPPTTATEAVTGPVVGVPAAGVVDGAGTPATAGPPAELTAPPVTDTAPVTEATATEATATVTPEAPVTPDVAAPPSASTAAAPTTTPSSEPPTIPETEAPAASVAAAGGAEAEPDATPGEVVPQGPLELGTYLSGKTVLLHFDPAKGGWFRVQPRSAVVAGERILSLPEFRPQITLSSGVTLDMSGGTQVVMSAGDEGGAAATGSAAPLIDILYGRIVLTNTSNADSEVRIKAGTHTGKAVLERNATLAIEVERPYVPGNDPRTTPSPVAATMHAPNGRVTWTDSSGEVVVEKPSKWTLTEGAPAEVVADAEPPEWIDREPVVHLSEQRFGAPKIEETLLSDRPVDIQLLELFKGRDRREVKSLVTRCGIHIGLFAPFIDAMRDPGQKWPTWRTHIETLRSAMAQSPESAEAVFQALVDQRGRPAAADLYEMLCGYNAEQIGTTPEQVKSGALAQLVDRLEEDSLDYRVLAVHDLWEITGKQLMPNPAANATVRKQNVRRWRDRLESGELLPAKQEE